MYPGQVGGCYCATFGARGNFPPYSKWHNSCPNGSTQIFTNHFGDPIHVAQTASGCLGKWPGYSTRSRSQSHFPFLSRLSIVPPSTCLPSLRNESHLLLPTFSTPSRCLFWPSSANVTYVLYIPKRCKDAGASPSPQREWHESASLHSHKTNGLGIASLIVFGGAGNGVRVAYGPRLFQFFSHWSMVGNHCSNS